MKTEYGKTIWTIALRSKHGQPDTVVNKHLIFAGLIFAGLQKNKVPLYMDHNALVIL
jgi:hypothetical protein